MSKQALTSLKNGQVALVEEIGHELKDSQRHRLLDLGIVPGAEIKLRLDGPYGDPRAFEIAGSVIALRKEQTDQIFIKQKR